MDKLNSIFQQFESLDLTNKIGIITIALMIIIPLLSWLFKKDPSIVINNNLNQNEAPTPEASQPSDPKEKSRKPPHQSEAPKPLPHTSKTKLFGRKKELAMLTRAWHNDKQNIVVLKAMGGTGKTALLKKWLDGFNDASKRTTPDKIYTWSFYSQGSAEDKQASADDFFDKALNFFGYQGNPIASAHDKGIKLAELINQQRSLLVLDGLEPLQYPVGIMHGGLKDEGLKALLQQLAAHNQGLCLISSRQHIEELADKPLVLPHDLEALQTADGVDLLKSYGVHGAEADLENAVDEVAGHALALNLLGGYVSKLLGGDIRKRDTIPALSKERNEGNHAEHVMQAYEIHLKGTTQLSILYMMGLFDRPVSAAAIQQLRDAKITDLSDNLGDEADWLYALDDLRKQQLLNSNNGSDALASPTHHTGEAETSLHDVLDTHPLIREYFAKQLKKQHPKAWRQAHRQLYHYYKEQPEKQQPDTLEEMQPLFAAIAHGCAAEMYQEAMYEVYWPQIQRKNDFYLTTKLGAFSSDLSAVSHFFSQHWSTPAAELTDNAKAAVLNWAAFRLRALGRLQEAVQPMQAAADMFIKQEEWGEAAANASSLSELQLTRGAVSLAITAAQQSVELADKSGDEFERISDRTALADAQHQAGELAESHRHFQQAETLQKEWQPEYPQLYSLSGFQYCDLLLTVGKWQEVQQRAEQTYEYRHQGWYSLLAIALDQLSLGRAALVGWVSDSVTQQTKGNPATADAGFPQGSYPTYDEVNQQALDIPLDSPVLPELEESLTVNDASLSTLQTAKKWLNQAVEGLRKAGHEDDLPRGLLARASYHRYCLSFGSDALASPVDSTVSAVDLDEVKASLPTAAESIKFALADLQETHDIAQRGGMLLHLTNYHLESARLALTIKQNVFDKTANEHIQKAKQLIDDTGYKRRLPEVEYLEQLLTVGGRG